MPLPLAGKTAIVTGGNGGIGLAIARALGAAGASITIVGRDLNKSQQALAGLQEAGIEATSFQADLTVEASCKAMVHHAEATFGPVNILVNNAGTNVRKQPEDYTLDEWHMLIDANLTSCYIASIAVFPTLKQRGGKIVNIGSMTSIFGASFSAPYGASKGGVVQLTKALASAWAKYDVQVNAVLPGWIETDLTIRGRAATPWLQEQVTARTPAGRWGKPEDIAGAVVFLASPAANFITGVALPVDGGYSTQA